MQEETPITLEVIRRLPGPPAAAPAVVSASTDLVLEVGAIGPAAGARYYSCPLYLLQSSCTALRDLLTDLLEGAMTEGVDAGLLPLPFVSADVFEVVAAYVEHFYRVGAEGTEGGQPAVRAPLRHEDLYALPLWVQRYCIEHLLRLPQLLARRGVPYDEAAEETWLRNGAWVDAMGSAPAASPEAAPPSLTTEEKQRTMQRLLQLVEAATRLGVGPLQGLCAALVANLLVGQPEDQVRAVLARPSSRPLEPFTAERRAALVQKHPWLNSSAAV